MRNEKETVNYNELGKLCECVTKTNKVIIIIMIMSRCAHNRMKIS